MMSTDKQTALVSILNQFTKTSRIHNYGKRSVSKESLMLSSLEPIKCLPFSRELVLKFGTLFLIPLKCSSDCLFLKR